MTTQHQDDEPQPVVQLLPRKLPDKDGYKSVDWEQVYAKVEDSPADEGLKLGAPAPAPEAAAQAALDAAWDAICGPEWADYAEARLEDVAGVQDGRVAADAAAWAALAARPRAPREARVLMLVGDPGPGKTHLGWAMLRHVHYAGRSVAAVRCSDYLTAMKDCRWGEDERLKRRRGYVTPDVLLLDNVGLTFRQVPSEADRENLFHLLDLRGNRRAPTIVTSNLQPKAPRDEDTGALIPGAPSLEVYLGPEAYDRLRYGAFRITLNGPSRRAPAPEDLAPLLTDEEAKVVAKLAGAIPNRGLRSV